MQKDILGGKNWLKSFPDIVISKQRKKEKKNPKRIYISLHRGAKQLSSSLRPKGNKKKRLFLQRKH